MTPFSNNDVKTSRLLYTAFNAARHELAVTSHPWAKYAVTNARLTRGLLIVANECKRDPEKLKLAAIHGVA